MIKILNNLNGENVEQIIESFFSWSDLAKIKEECSAKTIEKILDEYINKKGFDKKEALKAFVLSYLYMPHHFTNSHPEYAEKALDSINIPEKEKRLFWELYSENILQDTPLCRKGNLSITLNKQLFRTYLDNFNLNAPYESRYLSKLKFGYKKAKKEDKWYEINKKMCKDHLEELPLYSKEEENLRVKILEEIVQELKES